MFHLTAPRRCDYPSEQMLTGLGHETSLSFSVRPTPKKNGIGMGGQAIVVSSASSGLGQRRVMDFTRHSACTYCFVDKQRTGMITGNISYRPARQQIASNS